MGPRKPSGDARLEDRGRLLRNGAGGEMRQQPVANPLRLVARERRTQRLPCRLAGCPISRPPGPGALAALRAPRCARCVPRPTRPRRVVLGREARPRRAMDRPARARRTARLQPARARRRRRCAALPGRPRRDRAPSTAEPTPGGRARARPGAAATARSACHLHVWERAPAQEAESILPPFWARSGRSSRPRRGPASDPRAADRPRPPHPPAPRAGRRARWRRSRGGVGKLRGGRAGAGRASRRGCLRPGRARR